MTIYTHLEIIYVPARVHEYVHIHTPFPVMPIRNFLNRRFPDTKFTMKGIGLFEVAYYAHEYC